MARFFKPLLGAVALAVATLTSTGAFAAYAYNAQISITAPKGSTAEASAKLKNLPTGVKYSSCAANVTNSTGAIITRYDDYLQLNVKYDAGKAADELADVYVVLQDLSATDTGAAAPTLPAARYIMIGRVPTGSVPGTIQGSTGALKLATGLNLADLNPAGATPAIPFLAKSDNLGTGAQTEVILGNAINLTGLAKGLWSATVIIAKPGATGMTKALAGAPTAAVGTTSSVFLLGRPETWAAHDTVVFELGSPIAIDQLAPLTDIEGAAALATNAALVNCQ